MRFTSPAQGSHMPQGVEKTYLGWWGDLGSPKQKITTYSLSQNQQKAMGGAFEGYLIHGTKRLARHFPYWGPPFIGGYIWYDWANKKYDVRSPFPLFSTLPSPPSKLARHLEPNPSLPLRYSPSPFSSFPLNY
ncbi:cytochrome b-c1 complex subunit 8 [Mrakia frigida]|uniref:ubiquinol--cytochrome-c reductase subunit 8 n=1 Tax=Mrakia frigida TaxID=29902 RepID=UPI003FCBFF11